MVQLLYKYLIINKQVALPGVGVFYIQRQPAKHDYTNKVFVSPALQINFNASTALPDKKFYEFMSKEKGMDEAEAVKSLYAFANRITQEVKADKTVELPGFGMLRRNGSGQLTFQREDILTTYFPPTGVDGVLREKAEVKTYEKDAAKTAAKKAEPLEEAKEDEVSQKSYWWVYAIILALIGIGAIVYYYYVNGSLK
jgi:nucleoid DNA-binding protein